MKTKFLYFLCCFLALFWIFSGDVAFGADTRSDKADATFQIINHNMGRTPTKYLYFLPFKVQNLKVIKDYDIPRDHHYGCRMFGYFNLDSISRMCEKPELFVQAREHLRDNPSFGLFYITDNEIKNGSIVSAFYTEELRDNNGKFLSKFPLEESGFLYNTVYFNNSLPAPEVVGGGGGGPSIIGGGGNRTGGGGSDMTVDGGGGFNDIGFTPRNLAPTKNPVGEKLGGNTKKYLSILDLCNNNFRDTTLEPFIASYELVPAWTAKINSSRDKYSDEETVVLSASFTLDESFKNIKVTTTNYGELEKDVYISNQFRIPWMYSVGKGEKKFFKNKPYGNTISFKLSDLEGAKPGDNIYIYASCGHGDAAATKRIVFYKSLPFITSSNYYIAPTDSLLREIKITMKRPLDKSINERFTTLTIFSETKNIGGNNEMANTLFQAELSDLNIEGTEFTIPVNKHTKSNILKLGNYFMTISGQHDVYDENGKKTTANLTDTNSSLPEAIRQSLGKIYEFNVVKNSVPIEYVEEKAPKCSGDYGEAVFDLVLPKNDIGVLVPGGGSNVSKTQYTPEFEIAIKINDTTWGNFVKSNNSFSIVKDRAYSSTPPPTTSGNGSSSTGQKVGVVVSRPGAGSNLISSNRESYSVSLLPGSYRIKVSFLESFVQNAEGFTDVIIPAADEISVETSAENIPGYWIDNGKTKSFGKGKATFFLADLKRLNKEKGKKYRLEYAKYETASKQWLLFSRFDNINIADSVFEVTEACSIRLTVTDLDNKCTKTFYQDVKRENTQLNISLSADTTAIIHCFGEETGALKIKTIGFESKRIATILYKINSVDKNKNPSKYTEIRRYNIYKDSIKDLGGGDYFITIYDSIAQDSVRSNICTIYQAGQLDFSSIVLDSVSCNGGNNGGFRIGVLGGTLKDSSDFKAFLYYFDDLGVERDTTAIYVPTVISSVTGKFVFSKERTIIAQNYPSRDYTLKVSDKYGCEAIKEIHIPEPKPLEFVIDSINHYHYNAKGIMEGGYIKAFSIGGNGENKVFFDGDTSSAVQNGILRANFGSDSLLRAAVVNNGIIHTIHAIDKKYCKTDSIITIKFYDSLSPKAIKEKEISCYLGYDGKVRLDIEGGRPPYNIEWSNGSRDTLNELGENDNFTIDTIRLSELSSGTYLAKVSDYYGVKKESNSIYFYDPKPLSINEEDFIFKQPQYYGYTFGELPKNMELGRIDVEAFGGYGEYDFMLGKINEEDGEVLWDKDLGSKEIGFESEIRFIADDLEAGSYILNVSDKEGCEKDFLFSLSSAPNLKIDMVQTKEVQCGGDTNGAFSLQAFGGIEPYRFFYANLFGDTIESNTAQNIGAGTYTAWVVDSKGVVSIDRIEIREPKVINITIDSSINPSYDGFVNNDGEEEIGDGAFYLSLAGGSGERNFAFFDALSGDTIVNLKISAESSDTSFVIDNLFRGNYGIKASDAHACKEVLKVDLHAPDALYCGLHKKKDAACFGETSGSIEIEIEGGVPPYNYNISASGGKQGIFSSSKIDNFLLIENAGSGLYSIVVTDSNGIEARRTISLKEAPELQLELEPSMSPCNHSAQGFCVAKASGGTAPYSYLWEFKDDAWADYLLDSNYLFKDSLQNLGSGKIRLSLIDNNGCKVLDSTSIELPELLTAYANTKKNSYIGSLYKEFPKQDDDGELEIIAKGGVPPYKYSVWNSKNEEISSGNSVLKNLKEDKYVYCVEDSLLCVLTGEALIEKDSNLHVEISLLRGLNCYGGNDASVEAFVCGGKRPYEFIWTRNKKQLSSNDLILENLEYGKYELRITDANGVEAVDSILIENPKAVYASVEIVDASNFGLCDGWVELEIEGGSGDYVLNFEELGADGADDDLSHGGDLPLRVELGSERNYKIENLCKGSYKLNVKDALGCSYSRNLQISSPDSFCLYNISIVEPNAEFLGSISGEIRGGAAPYKYSFYNADLEVVLEEKELNQSRFEIENLRIGNYRFVLEDRLGNKIEENWILEENSGLQAKITVIEQISCAGEAGVLGVKLFGSKGEEAEKLKYSWFWSAGSGLAAAGGGSAGGGGGSEAEGNLGSADGNDNSNLEKIDGGGTELDYTRPGKYFLQVEDENGILAKDSIWIEQASKLVIDSEIIPKLERMGEDFVGGIRIDIAGGKEPYNIEWNTGENSKQIDCQKDIVYSLKIQDANGCELEKSFIDFLSPLEANISVSKPIKCYGESEAEICVEILGGFENFDIECRKLSSGKYSRGSEKIEQSSSRKHLFGDLSGGTYLLTIKDAYGRVDSSLYTITEPKTLKLSTFHKDVSCFGMNDGEVEVEVEGGKAPYNFVWSNGSSFSSLKGLEKGSYEVFVTDSNDCVSSASINIKEPQALSIKLDVDEAVCVNDKSYLTMSASGGNAPYSYNWKLVNASGNYTELGSDSVFIADGETSLYMASITDSKNCKSDTSLLVKAPKALEWELEREQILCPMQSIDIEPKFLNIEDMENAEISGFWQLSNGDFNDSLKLSADSSGWYKLCLIQYGECVYRDSVLVSEIEDTVNSSFWISTDITKGHSGTAVDISSPKSDSVHWIVPENVQIVHQEGWYAELMFLDSGYFPVSLISYRGRCSDSKTTYVRVIESDEVQFSKAKDRRFSYAKVLNNPTNGSARIALKLKERQEVEYLLIEASSGKICKKGILDIKDENENILELDIENKSGLYTLMIKCLDEIISIKIVNIKQ